MKSEASDASWIYAIERPNPKLLTYYILCCLMVGPFFPIVMIPAWFRYHTMRYRFDEDGISMRWGILFRREIVLSYARFQDIHLSSNFVERWLGLARIEIQTASGSAKAEMTIEGLLKFEAIRDFLYTRMRGHQSSSTRRTSDAAADKTSGHVSSESVEEIALALRELAVEVRGVRKALEQSRPESTRKEVAS